MALIHFLNVKQGDCSIIQHNSNRVTVIDVCNAKDDTEQNRISEAITASMAEISASLVKAAGGGNFNQKKYPVNPVTYLKDFGVNAVFRFILTHPDMDHMDGLKVFWDEFGPGNLWDTDNTCAKEGDFKSGCPYNQDDWDFYKQLRDGSVAGVKRLALLSGARGKYWNEKEDGTTGADGLQILAPTKELVNSANECDDFNDCSYVILYRTESFRILFGGDSHDETWKHILSKHEACVSDIDLLIAPHHGRKSDRCYDFLDVLKPKMTLFGNAASEHLAYGAWNNRKLPYITNNQAGSIVVYPDSKYSSLDLYVTNESFARSRNGSTFYSDFAKAWYLAGLSKKRP